MSEFWQRCPSGIEVTETDIQIHLLAASTELTELQPGEKCTRTVWLQLSDTQDQNHENHCYENTVRCVHQPITALPHEAAIVSSNALEWYAPDDQKNSPRATITGTARPNEVEQQLLNEMLRGPTNFLWKREQIDEYGWRNFGDFWADHEELYADDPSPVISHYNNQYDLLHGLLREYLRSQNPQWWTWPNHWQNTSSVSTFTIPIVTVPPTTEGFSGTQSLPRRKHRKPPGHTPGTWSVTSTQSMAADRAMNTILRQDFYSITI